jgi:hypothetical protein
MNIFTPSELFKAKYTRRWKNKKGEWQYEYDKPKGSVKVAAGGKSVKIDAFKMGWNIAAAKKFGTDMSSKHPNKYITMHDIFGEVTFTIHNSLPKNVYAPGDFKYGYAHEGMWKEWSAKRKATYSNKMIEGVE